MDPPPPPTAASVRAIVPPPISPPFDDGEISPYITLSTGARLPRVGLGTAALGGAGTEEAIAAALRVGIRHVDTASNTVPWYRNEHIVGSAVAAAVERGAITSPHDVFVTTKMSPGDFAAARGAIRAAVQNLRRAPDLMLIHFPHCQPSFCSPNGTWQEAWREMEAATHRGELRAIGVSNFDVPLLDELWALAAVKPAAIQSHMDPLRAARGVRAWCRRHGVAFVAYSTLGTQWQFIRRATPSAANPVLTAPAVLAAAAHTQSTPAQAVLRWALENGAAVIPRSRNATRLAEAVAALAAARRLPRSDFDAIEALDGTSP